MTNQTLTAQLRTEQYTTVLMIDGADVRTYSNRYDAEKIAALGNVETAEVVETWTGGGIATVNGQQFQYGRAKTTSAHGVMDNRHRNWRRRSK